MQPQAWERHGEVQKGDDLGRCHVTFNSGAVLPLPGRVTHVTLQERRIVKVIKAYDNHVRIGFYLRRLKIHLRGNILARLPAPGRETSEHLPAWPRLALQWPTTFSFGGRRRSNFSFGISGYLFSEYFCVSFWQSL